MAVTLLPNGMQTFLDANGKPLADGKVYFYVPNTSPPQFKDTWEDIGQVTTNPNPITLDGAGRAVVWGNGTYRQVVYDLNGVLIWDELTSSGPDASLDTFYDFAVFMEGMPTASELYPILAITRNLNLPAGLTSSEFIIKATTFPTSSFVVTLLKGTGSGAGSSIGTITFNTSGIPTVSFASQVFFAPGDTFQVLWPAIQDATAANISLTFVFSVGS